MSRKKYKKNNLFEKFGSRLKNARKELGFSTSKMADIIGIKENSYYKYEDGSRFPRPDVLESILNKLNLNLNYLIAGKGPVFIRDRKNQLYELVHTPPLWDLPVNWILANSNYETRIDDQLPGLSRKFQGFDPGICWTISW